MLLSQIESDIIFRQALQDNIRFFINGLPLDYKLREAVVGQNFIEKEICFHYKGCDFSFYAKIEKKDDVVSIERISFLAKLEKECVDPMLIVYVANKVILCYANVPAWHADVAEIEHLDGKSLLIKTIVSHFSIGEAENATVEFFRYPLSVRFSGKISAISEKFAKISFSDIPFEVARFLNENPVRGS